MRRLLLFALACCTLLAAAPAAHALSSAALRAKLSRQMHHAGPYASAYVRDLTTGRVLYEHASQSRRIPASVEKLYTTATALLRLGAEAQLRTVVLGRGVLDDLGVWRGDLYLRGVGDPTLDDRSIVALARTLGEAGIRRVAGSALGDESFFDDRRGSAHSNFAFDRDMGGWLSALTIDRGYARDGLPAAEAARRLAKRLRRDGIAVDGRSGAGTAPVGAVELAAVSSPTIGELIRRTNVPSDNFYAETLVKLLGARFGGSGTTAAGTTIIRDQLAAMGVRPQIVDGSGLSRDDRTTPRQVVRLLTVMSKLDAGAAFRASLPIAGRTGTIDDRMRASAAQDRCQAKTGTLIDVSTLAGYCDAVGGHTIAFAFMMNATSVTPARRVQDQMTISVARYDGS